MYNALLPRCLFFSQSTCGSMVTKHIENAIGIIINCAQKSICALSNCQLYQTLKQNVKMECIHEKRSFLLRILTPLPLLCNVVWLSYGYSNGLRSNFKSCKSPYSIQIQTDTRSCITKDRDVEIEWEASQLLKIDLKPLDDP